MNRYVFPWALVLAALLTVPATALCAADGKQTIKAQPQRTEPVAVRTEPPEIIVSNRPALLVSIDGPPEYALVKGAEPLLWRVVNTRVLLLKNAGGRHYLHLYDGYLQAGSLNEPWSAAVKVPKGIILAEKAARSSKKINLLEGKPDPRTRKKPTLRKTLTPWIYLSMIPTELIITDGEPDFISIEGTRLFYARNTTGDLFWHQGDRSMYLLASGFWFRAESYLGPWEIVPDDGLPPDFRVIPDTSVKRRVKASVPPPPKAPTAEVHPGSGNSWLEALLAGRFSWQGAWGSSAAGLAPGTAQKEWCR